MSHGKKRHLKQWITAQADAPIGVIATWPADFSIVAVAAPENPNPAAKLDMPDAAGGKDKPASSSGHSAGGKGDKPPVPRFNLSAYNGGPMKLVGWRFPVVVDATGVKAAAANLPIYVFHAEDYGKPSDRINQLFGQTDEFSVDQASGQITASGTITGESDLCKQAQLHAANGFKWQASINAQPSKVDFIPENVTAKVNGREVSGPCVVARAVTVDHIALVPLGADTSTSAKLAAAAAGETIMEFTAWIKATYPSIDPAKLTDAETARFKAEFNGVKPAPAKVEETSVIKAAAVTDPADAIKAQNAALAGNLKRISAVQAAAKDFPAIAAQAIEEGWGIDKTEVAVMRAERDAAKKAVDKGLPNINTGAMPEIKAGLTLEASSGGRHMESDIRRDGLARMIEAKALISAGYSGEKLAKDGCYGSEVVNAAMDRRFSNRFGRQLGPIGIFKMAAEFAGVQLPDKSNQSEFFGALRAEFSTMVLPVILSNLMNKFLLDGYLSVDPDMADSNEQSIAWQKFVKRGPVQDFKPHYRVRLTGSVETQPLGPTGEIQHGQLLEQSYTIQAKTRAIMLAMTREAIINDDLSALSTVPTHIGVGHGRTIAKSVYATLLNNMQSDWSTAFFAAAITTAGNLMGKNLCASSALNFANLEASRAVFGLQTDPTGAPFGQQPKIILVPPGLLGIANALYMAQDLIASLTSGGTARGTPSTNTLRNLYQPVCSAWLVNCPAVKLPGGVSFTGSVAADATSWYLMCSASAPAYCMEAGFLNGQEMPIVERAEAEFDTLGIAFRGFGDFGISMAEPRAAQKNNV